MKILAAEVEVGAAVKEACWAAAAVRDRARTEKEAAECLSVVVAAVQAAAAAAAAVERVYYRVRSQAGSESEDEEAVSEAVTEMEDVVLWDAEDEERKMRARWEVEARGKAEAEARLEAALRRQVTGFWRLGRAYERLGESVKRGLAEMAKSAAEAAAVDVQSVLAAPVEEREEIWHQAYFGSVWEARHSATMERRRRAAGERRLA